MFTSCVFVHQRVQYLNIRCVSLAVPPGAGYRGEGAVSVVKLPSLEVQKKCGEGFLLIRTKKTLQSELWVLLL